MRFERQSLIVTLICLIGLSVNSTVIAQDSEPEGVVQQRSMVIEATDDGSSGQPRIQMFTSDSLDGPVMLGGLTSIAPTDPFSLASNKGVQKELELVDDQLQQMKDINKEFSKRMQEQIKELTSGKMTGDRGMNLADAIKAMQKEKRERLEQVLLPHQLDRLKQISLQSQMRQSGDSNILTSAKLMEELGISEEQKKRLRKRAKELKAEMEQEIKKLKAKAKAELLKELDADQRKKLKDMLGEDFEVKRPSFEERFKLKRSKSTEEDN